MGLGAERRTRRLLRFILHPYSHPYSLILIGIIICCCCIVLVAEINKNRKLYTPTIRRASPVKRLTAMSERAAELSTYYRTDSFFLSFRKATTVTTTYGRGDTFARPQSKAAAGVTFCMCECRGLYMSKNLRPKTYVLFLASYQATVTICMCARYVPYYTILYTEPNKFLLTEPQPAQQRLVRLFGRPTHLLWYILM